MSWAAIREGLSAYLPEFLPWTTWCHWQPVPVTLPSGDVAFSDRGAEQGDLIGPMYCAVVLAMVVHRARTRLGLAAGAEDHGERAAVEFFDAWYMDHGQVFCDLPDADAVLRAMDVEAAEVGAVRGRGRDIKSVARLVGPGELVAA